MHSILFIALFAVPALSLVLWHFVFLMAVNSRHRSSNSARTVRVSFR